VAASADVTILVQDASAPSFAARKSNRSLAVDVLDLGNSESEGALETASAGEGPPSFIVIANKTDLTSARLLPGNSIGNLYYTSFTSGEGVDAVVEALEATARRRLEGVRDHADGSVDSQNRPEAPVITRTRHRFHVERTVEALETFVSGRSGPIRAHYLPMDLATEELRIACRELGAITGTIHVEEVLDVIFNDFCIGK
jgi:tRNA U34 5-carboxymethylaminomethyl modifying GTPase MnmE/TrmE